MVTKYPLTVVTVGRQDFILATVLQLALYDEKDIQDGAMPLQMFKKYSCLKLNFSNSKTKTGADGNIELSKLDSVWLKTKACIPLLMTPKGIKENALLRVLSFVPNDFGMMAKKSCIQIGRQLTFDQVVTLGQKMQATEGKYAARNAENGKLLIDAAYVAEAERQGILSQLDTTEKRNAFLQQVANHPSAAWYQTLVQMLEKHPEYLEEKATGDLYIYNAPMKVPHSAKVDAQGLTKVYSLTITCNPQKQMPFNVTLVTGKGKPLGNASVGIQEGTYVRGETFSQDLTCEEWVNIIAQAIHLRDSYVTQHIEAAMMTAIKLDQANRQQYQQQQQNQYNQYNQQPQYQPQYQAQQQNQYQNQYQAPQYQAPQYQQQYNAQQVPPTGYYQ